MKKLLALCLSGLTLLLFTAACGSIPSLSFESTNTPLPSPTPNLTPGTPTPTFPPPPTDVPTPTLTPTITLTPSLTPTPKIYAPAVPGTPVIDMGFPTIDLTNVPQLTPAFQAMRADVRQAVASRDGEKLFVSTSNGLFVFDKSGQPLAHWLDVFTFDIPCQKCLDVNRDGSRFAVLTRRAGHWEVEVFDVQGKWKTLKLAFPVATNYLGAGNEGLVVLSPDDLYLAYAAGASALRVFNLQSGLQVFSSTDPLSDVAFTPDGALFITRQDRNLLFYSTKDWGKPASVLLPASDTPFAVSPDVKTLAIAYGTRLRIYSLATLKSIREFNQPPGGPWAWQLSFVGPTTLQGLSVQWNGTRTQATVTTAEWDIQTGKSTRLDSADTASPSPFPPQWNMTLPLEDTSNGLKAGEYNGFRFISNEMVLINTAHAVCWVKILTAEQTCVEDAEHLLFSADSIAYKEVVGDRTLIQSWKGDTILDVGKYHIVAIDRQGNWLLVDVKGLGTDLYAKNKTLPRESVGGAFQGFADSLKTLAFTTQRQSKEFIITVFNKTSGKTLAQQKDTFLYKPLVLKKDGTLFMLQRDLDKNQIIVNVMAPPDYQIKEVTRLTLPAAINQMAFSVDESLLALALDDGSVVVYNPDFSFSDTFQAFDSPVLAVSFSPDGRFLAAASRAGIKVFAVKP